MSALTPASYPQLMEVLASKQKIVYLCGAGASMALCNHNITWANWILAGKSYLDASKQIELEKKLGSWSSDELINAATFLLEQLKVSVSTSSPASALAKSKSLWDVCLTPQYPSSAMSACACA